MATFVDPRVLKPITDRLTGEALEALNSALEGVEGGGVTLPIEISDVNGLEDELGSKASASDIPDVSGLATKTELTNGLAGKANATHVHAQGDITGLVDALNTKADVSQLPSANQLIPTPPTSGVYHLVSTDGVISWEEVVE